MYLWMKSDSCACVRLHACTCVPKIAHGKSSFKSQISGLNPKANNHDKIEYCIFTKFIGILLQQRSKYATLVWLFP